MPDVGLVRVKRALVSVSDKSGIVGLASALAERDVEVISTGGTAATLGEAGVPIVEVSDYTGFPEIMGGRVKTLHPRVHGGILARRDRADDLAAMLENRIQPIDLVVINLYPFEETVAGGADPASCIENIDIGGPALIRAAAKNHAHVTVIVDPDDYRAVVEELEANDGATGPTLRRRLAVKAFARTAAYDAAIQAWLAAHVGDDFPDLFASSGHRRSTLRYGENPHQRAALYVGGDPRAGVATAAQIQGKELSYNNLSDADAAYELVAEFAEPTVAIIKHGNPCGVASAAELHVAYARALATDPQSAFGGIVATNRTMDEATARAVTEIFTEVVIAPDADPEARGVLAHKTGLRVLVCGALPDPAGTGSVSRPVAGGFLVQDRDGGTLTGDDLRIVTERQPTPREIADMLFAFKVCKHVKSNAIVYARDGATVGLGAGQMSRVDSARIAAIKAREAGRAAGETAPRLDGSVVASDAFFPFADGLLAAIEAGARAVIQPGGSLRDDEVIAAADEHDVAMAFTGMRHFRH
ncbi:MAG: bifunctional phosphoribosylaminoimidazolecarboxamide formyltransferase/IMP cyclohydrolase [Alphaproteobacteria bacterium]